MSGFACVECGHKFRTIKAAEKAAFGSEGCPKCGSSDIDLSPAAREPDIFDALAQSFGVTVKGAKRAG